MTSPHRSQPGNTSELLPCPFCGTTALIDRDVSHDDDGYHEISCTNCTGSSDRFIGVHAANRPEAVDFWNTRAPHAGSGVQSVDGLAQAKAYVDQAIASYAGDPADNQFQKGFLAALEVVREEAFSLSSATRGSDE